MKRFGFLFLLLSLCLLTGVPATAVAAGYERGQELYQLGRQDQALSVLRDYVRSAPVRAETARAYALIGRILTEQKKPEEAILYLQRTPEVLRSPEIELLHGHALATTGRFADALQMLQPLLDEPLASADKRLLLTSLTDATSALEQYLLALFYLQQQIPLVDNPETILDQAHQLLQNRLSNQDLEEAAFMWQGTPLGQDAQLQLARRALARQNPELAKEYLRHLFAVGVAFPFWQEAEALMQRASVDGWLNRNNIGVLLPLSGPYAAYGELVQKGLELALQEHNKAHFPIRFIYRDTAAGTPLGRLVDVMANEERVIAILGPLLSADALAAARVAQQQMIPMLALSQMEGLPQVGGYVFRDTLTAQQQVKSLVEYALANSHISFSILHPQNRLGQQMAQLFQAAVRRSGGEIVDVISYPEGTNDFRAQIEQLLWRDRVQPIAEEKTGGKPDPEYPLAPFHALFIPDYAENIMQIAPQLMFYGIRDVLLLGINGWNSPELISRTGRFLNDAVFVDAFYPQSNSQNVQHFVKLFRERYQTDPTILEAQAFDAATLLLRTVDRPDIRNRDDLRAQLHTVDNVNGVTGTRGFDADGEAIKKLNLLGVQRGHLIELAY